MRPKVLIPYQQTWEVASHIPEWEKLKDKLDFIEYKMTNADDFREYLHSNDIAALWVTEEFFRVLGGPTPYIEDYPSSLRVIAVPWVGCDFIDGKMLLEKYNIYLCNIGPHAVDNVTDLAIHLVVSCFRLTSFWEYCFRFSEPGSIDECKKYVGGTSKDQITKDGALYPQKLDDDQSRFLNLAKDFNVAGKKVDSPTKKTALILGFGSIGQNIGSKLKFSFDMKIKYYKRSGEVPREQLGYDAIYCSDLQSADTWQDVDVIVLALPGSPSTDDIINDSSLGMCKDGVRIVNVGRGSCIDEDALISALDSGKVNSCGLDVYKNEETLINEKFLKRWDVTLLPHIGSAVADMMVRQTIITLDNIEDILLKNGEGIYRAN
ncbi:uncharacterized protein GVI51_J06941 [Nakaseomyces glabratus]|uniref:D-isomer specific 2-hydroxyacid dehydrogenase NAD-binding domain-containing protein n=1 Tax=Candida glabrata (strain ATCC 2001 / BCRC 20586 / JCM 3761 / NBRC 0622 / NRRL Y-65 / CBS 138) TaxID=284593 RepID=Q6FP30_CANGA|nr:uncharacterized protein CAGL0J07084g [Nakaseomyces glabratus]KAH7583621.1 D-isomer specific 2-hydroxyacid dehydrogenase, NAD binding domain [Nakaseomyces glabratus]KAH7584111.1 D-isomer specific 2-hydroxyacid dehydrogenase, NAD binding domain [Nakaseomyces glabratus]KAH7597855.1 D-isomer specific 2-hydroxyacid dehydrogenase, NAD binding domain [Nakaseomyces glabratus]KAH7598433.1 D-isomer specific 2-hydroxyacid dehydrogenase, NAD binding domain [Nakaseomyces glabratus]KAH7603862.1 D-isomer |eukprot:XP_448014.1 uncharacterized protein CAGL0J07084g [[Candida] glabrata]